MILLDSKATKASSNNSLNTPQDIDKKSTLSFSDLLKGVSKTDAKESKDSKVIQNGALVLNISKEKEDVNLASKTETKTKKEDFSSLLKNPQKDDEKSLPQKDLKTQVKTTQQKDVQVLQDVVVNPQVIKNISPKELKALIVDAKKYLKDQIIQSDGYKKAQIKDLPKTLKGLLEVAKKFDIDVTKISLENVKENAQSVKKTNLDLKKDIKTDVKPEQKTELKQEIKPQVKQEVKLETRTQTKIQEKQEVKTEIKSDVKQEIKPDTKHEPKTQIKPDIKTEPRLEVKQDHKAQVNQDIKNEPKSEVKHTPLFKAQITQSVVTTEQALQVREHRLTDPSNPLRKSAKQRADETLKLLLRGDKPQKLDTPGINITSDFSVATAKVIAPNATTQAQNSLESLLRGDTSETGTTTKQENILTTPKADSFEVKINEAKQMTKYLSADVKQAIDNYKSPFTRVRVQLNPQNLGEVDLTVVQRGKNLHVNISSNNVAINALAMNANDLKVQLNNSGIQNATLNFNSGSSDGGGANQQQQNHRQNQQASQEYSYFDNEEQNEEVLSSLEIVVPSYA